MTCAAYEIKTGLSGDGMTLSLPWNDEIASLDGNTAKLTLCVKEERPPRRRHGTAAIRRD
jgi:hypothetical protein